MAKQTIYYSDPLQDDFAGNHIRGKVVDQNFPLLQAVGIGVLPGVLWNCSASGISDLQDLSGDEV